ncbi:MAG: DUF2442 domain-containing protein [Flavobacteriales bacterium]|nr:DUF2442 domain-containing protein [Flavobacteriales bacterium]
MIHITNITTLPNRRLEISFDDGTEKIADINVMIGEDEMTSPLKNFDYFSKVNILENGRGIYWPNEFDLCADFLRYHIQNS